jgi:hypothetical protein
MDRTNFLLTLLSLDCNKFPLSFKIMRHIVAFLVMLVFFAIQYQANASRGWYISVAGVSSKQSHKATDRTVSYTVYNNNNNTLTQNYTVSAANIQNTAYWFKKDSTQQDSATPPAFASFTTLSNAMSGKYIITDTTFSLYTDVTTGASTPYFANTSKGFTFANNTSPTNIIGGNIASAIITHTGTSTQVAKIDRRTGLSNATYLVTLKPIDWSSKIATVKDQINSELNASGLNTTQQLQDFLDVLQNNSSKGVELSIGYKFRPFQSSWFLAPQVDVSYFKGNNQNSAAYANSGKTDFNLTSDSTHTQKITYDSIDLSFSTSMVAKIGLENHLFFGASKVPFSIYGLVGGASSMRKYKSVQANNLGLKYGFGGEVFLSKKLAFFAEVFQIQFLQQKVESSASYSYTTSADNNTNTGGSITLTNGGTGANLKSTTINYASLEQAVGNIKYKTDEAFKINSKLSAIKVGLTYYL